MVKIRPIKDSEVRVLPALLYESIFVPEGDSLFPINILADEDVIRYYSCWGREGDKCLVALSYGVVIGGVWSRFIPEGYGYFDDDTPELSISIFRYHQKAGIGGMLLDIFCEELRSCGLKKVSLAVHKHNYALHMYLKKGFKVIRENSDHFVMLKSL